MFMLVQSANTQIEVSWTVHVEAYTKFACAVQPVLPYMWFEAETMTLSAQSVWTRIAQLNPRDLTGYAPISHVQKGCYTCDLGLIVPLFRWRR